MSSHHAWKESTRESYQKYLENHVYPVFGKTKLGSIHRKDCKAFFDGLLANGKATETVAVIRAAMSGVLTHAVESEVIEANPLREIKLRGKSSNRSQEEIDPLKDEEAEAVLEEAREYQGGRYYPRMVWALRTGMRIGEIIGLRWGDVDFAGRFLEVRRSWRKRRLTGTKNKRRRRVDMTPLLAETLRVLQVEEKKRALRQGRPVSESVFAEDTGEVLHLERFRVALNKCLERAGLRRIRVHDLRHSCASIRLNRGHNVGDVSKQLGHSSIKITFDVYGHLVPGKFKSEVDGLDAPARQPATPAQPVGARPYECSEKDEASDSSSSRRKRELRSDLMTSVRRWRIFFRRRSRFRSPWRFRPTSKKSSHRRTWSSRAESDGGDGSNNRTTSVRIRQLSGRSLHYFISGVDTHGLTPVALGVRIQGSVGVALCLPVPGILPTS